jgi:ABC-2 type transport system permease protein
MTAFWTLMKREYLDHRGGMFWTPLVVSTVMSILMVIAAVQILTHVNGNVTFNTSDDFNTGMADGTVTKPDGSVITKETKLLPDGSKQKTVTVKDKNGEQRVRVTVDVNENGDQSGGNINLNGVDFHDMKGLAGSLNHMSSKDRLDGARTYGAMTSAIGASALLISLFVVPFLLLSSLFDERQDRSILFWKSMPVSDRKTVLTKLLANSAGTFAIALAFGMVVHFITLIVTTLVASHYGFNSVGDLWHLPTIASAWVNWILLALLYLMWALPVYAWLMLVSAASPRAPFLFAFLIPGGLALLEVASFKSHFVVDHFLGRLIGAPLAQAFDKMSHAEKFPGGPEMLSKTREMLLANFVQPELWIGILVAAALLYATIEVRKRRTL